MITLWGEVPQASWFQISNRLLKYCGCPITNAMNNEVTHECVWGAGIGDTLSTEFGDSIKFFARKKIEP